MSDYFRYFPSVQYDGKVLADITRRTDLTERFSINPEAFLPYTVPDGYRPEDVAFYYYDDVRYTWLLFAANDIVDPYYEWPQSSDDLMKTIGMKYRDRYFALYSTSLSYTAATEIPTTEVLQWTKNTTVNNNIVEYRAWANSELKINQDTYDVLFDPDVVQGEYYPVRIYDYEVEQNDNRREIYVIDYQIAESIVNRHEELLK